MAGFALRTPCNADIAAVRLLCVHSEGHGTLLSRGTSTMGCLSGRPSTYRTVREMMADGDEDRMKACSRGRDERFALSVLATAAVWRGLARSTLGSSNGMRR